MSDRHRVSLVIGILLIGAVVNLSTLDAQQPVKPPPPTVREDDLMRRLGEMSKRLERIEAELKTMERRLPKPLLYDPRDYR